MFRDEARTTGLGLQPKRLGRMGRVAGPTADCCEENNGNQPQQQMTIYLCLYGHRSSSNR